MSRVMKTAVGAAALAAVLLAGGAGARAADSAEKAAAHAYIQDRLDTHMGFHCGSFKICRGHSAAKPAVAKAAPAPKAARESDVRQATLAYYSASARR